MTSKLKEAYPTAKLRRGAFELTIRGEDPAQVAQGARLLLEKAKLATKKAKEFK